jgi:Transport and Golgi organisation 2
MCTVSWVSAQDGYTLCFNRDERHTRAAALPPTVHEIGGVRYLAPLDGDFGGTWLAANQYGLTLALLNRYRVSGYQPPPEPQSRGLLIPALIQHSTAVEALAALESRDLGPTQPFSLVALEPGQPVRVAAWDGIALTALTHRAPGLILTSSSVTEPEVALARRAIFRAQQSFTPVVLASLHHSHLPERGRCSICMHRDDAETQSYSDITATPKEIRLAHTPDAPCRGTALPTLRLKRHPLSALDPI